MPKCPMLAVARNEPGLPPVQVADPVEQRDPLRHQQRRGGHRHVLVDSLRHRHAEPGQERPPEHLAPQRHRPVDQGRPGGEREHARRRGQQRGPGARLAAAGRAAGCGSRRAGRRAGPAPAGPRPRPGSPRRAGRRGRRTTRTRRPPRPGPRIRAGPGPPSPARWITRSRGSAAARASRMAPQPSGEASSTAITSIPAGRSGWPRIESRQPGRYSSTPRTARITLISGASGGPLGPVIAGHR